MRTPRRVSASTFSGGCCLAARALTAAGCAGEGPRGTVTDDVDLPANAAPVFAGRFDVVVDEGAASTLELEVSDPDGDLVAVSLGGEDTAHFIVSAEDFTLIPRAPFDFEVPADADADDVYELTLVATDGDAQTEQAVTITVRNVADTALESVGGLLLLGGLPGFDFDEPGLGTQLTGLGDLDGDGRDELAVSAPNLDLVEEGSDDGRTYVLPARALITLEEAVVELDEDLSCVRIAPMPAWAAASWCSGTRSRRRWPAGPRSI